MYYYIVTSVQKHCISLSSINFSRKFEHFKSCISHKRTRMYQQNQKAPRYNKFIMCLRARWLLQLRYSVVALTDKDICNIIIQICQVQTIVSVNIKTCISSCITISIFRSAKPTPPLLSQDRTSGKFTPLCFSDLGSAPF